MRRHLIAIAALLVLITSCSQDPPPRPTPPKPPQVLDKWTWFAEEWPEAGQLLADRKGAGQATAIQPLRTPPAGDDIVVTPEALLAATWAAEEFDKRYSDEQVEAKGLDAFREFFALAGRFPEVVNERYTDYLTEEIRRFHRDRQAFVVACQQYTAQLSPGEPGADYCRSSLELADAEGERASRLIHRILAPD